MLGANQLHDIAPPVDYSQLSPWLVFLGSVLILSAFGVLFLFARKLFRREKPERSARERTLEALREVEGVLEKTAPYAFSIRLSDILRRYVVEQYHLPMTRQTSVEFLTAIGGSDQFAQAERMLLTDFLERCDLIKFARYEATVEDSRSLLEEARQFVKGGSVVHA